MITASGFCEMLHKEALATEGPQPIVDLFAAITGSWQWANMPREEQLRLEGFVSGLVSLVGLR